MRRCRSGAPRRARLSVTEKTGPAFRRQLPMQQVGRDGATGVREFRLSVAVHRAGNGSA